MIIVTKIYKKYRLGYHHIMLKEQYRLKKRSAFNATYKSGTSVRDGGITLFCGKVKNLEIPTKIGFVVSKKIHKRAVKRNRIKRLMREAVRLYIKNYPEIFDTKYISLIFVATSKLLNSSFKDIDLSVHKIMDIVTND